MSAPRKRAAIRKAEYEIDRLQQKIMLLEHQYSVMKSLAEVAVLAEREACANKIRDLRNQAVTPKFATMRECEAYSHALDAAESAIRARGRQLPQPPPPPTRRSSHARINRST